MQLTNNYWFFKQALTPENCKKIIDLGLSEIDNRKNRGESVEGVTGGGSEKGNNPDAKPINDRTRSQISKEKVYDRDSKVAWLYDQWLYDLVLPYIHKANESAGWNWDFDFSESFQFTIYEPDGFYGWHTDGGSDHSAIYQRYIEGLSPPRPYQDKDKLPPGYVKNQNLIGKIRKISCTINLNVPGEYDGGNLKFDFGNHREEGRFHECEEIRPQGSIVVFPSFLPHCVTPVTKGTRYSLVLWCVGEPWK